MIRFIKLLLLFILIGSSGYGQNNVFNCEDSKRFAAYLFNTRQYELAQQELERIQFFCDLDSLSQFKLLQSYRLQKKYTKANVFFLGKSFENINAMAPNYRLEYIRLLMAQKEYDRVTQLINEGLQFQKKESYLLGTLLLTQKWEEAYEFSIKESTSDNLQFNRLKIIAQNSYTSKRKNKFLSTAISVLIPGSGKMYCEYWGDGVISFLFTASSAFFAYRAFEKYGTQNVYPWIISGLAVSYYAGNVYGGNRAAVHYNEKLEHEFIHETENILSTDF